MTEIANYMTYVWLAVMALLVVIEAMTVALVSIWGAISALLMIFISRTGMAPVSQVLLFLLMSIVLMVLTRPFAVRKLGIGKNKTNVDAMVGEEVLVTKEVRPFQKGEAKSKNGVIWSVTGLEGKPLARGAVAIVHSVQGNTLVVKEKGVN